MSDATTPSSAPPSNTPRGVDLDALERGMRSASGTDLTEAKEAAVEALLQLAVQNARARVALENSSSASNLRPSL